MQIFIEKKNYSRLLLCCNFLNIISWSLIQLQALVYFYKWSFWFQNLTFAAFKKKFEPTVYLYVSSHHLVFTRNHFVQNKHKNTYPFNLQKNERFIVLKYVLLLKLFDKIFSYWKIKLLSINDMKKMKNISII